MNVVSSSSLTVAEYQGLIRQADPEALLVPARILRRAIKHERAIRGIGLRVPHRDLYLIRREALLACATPAELGTNELPETVLLLPLPDQAELMRQGREAALAEAWRRLFHGRIHREFARLQLDAAAIRERVQAVGDAAIHEARDVLRQDHRLLAEDDATVYEEFAAVWLERRAFDPARLLDTFPAADHEAVARLLARDLDADALLQATRPAGAEMLAREQKEEAGTEDDDAVHALPEELMEQAAQAASKGNRVRAALLQQRAEGGSRRPGHLADLVKRLMRAMRLPSAEREAWTECLGELLEPASRGYWNREARILYDLQSASIDLERPLYAADLVEWFVTLFQRPIKRRLPDLPLVLAVGRVRKALSRLPAARLPDAFRTKLEGLLRRAEHRLETRLRDALRPKILAALDQAGLVPSGVAERLSRDRVVEDLLDKVAERGFLGMGDLRDALARSRLKLPDLRSPWEAARGDPLLRANENLARSLDGIYRRGEAYLRWMQTLSSVFFGTLPGRLLTLYVLLPVLAAVFTLLGFDYLTEEIHHFIPAVPAAHTFDTATLIGVSLFYLCLIHLPRFRAAVGRAFWLLWRGLRGVLYDAPLFAWRSPVVQALLGSRAFRLFWQFVGRPLASTLPLALVLWLCGVPPDWLLAACALWFLLAATALNTRLGLLLEENAADGLSRLWLLLRDDLFMGAIRGVLWAFAWLLERVDIWFYAIDERLRFREGEGRLVFAIKLVLGVLWFFVKYVVRFALVLLIEPQINPVKHFPVVTVSHKLTLLAVQPLSEALNVSAGLVLGVLGLIPGVFGFLAWELTENWRLYRANQSPTLDPEIIGSHGERMINFVRPGFHSGTLPRLFATLRNSEGAARRNAGKRLHHAEEELQRFIERGLLAPLAASKAWAAPLSTGHIALATNRVRAELACPSLGEPATLELRNDGGRLAARFAEAGWTAKLDGIQRQAMEAVLAGFYKLAGVEEAEGADGFAQRPVAWEQWSRWWERDAATEARPELLPGSSLCPGPTSGERQPVRDTPQRL